MNTFTLAHVAISLAAIVTGRVIMLGLLTANRRDGWAAVSVGTVRRDWNLARAWLLQQLCHTNLQ